MGLVATAAIAILGCSKSTSPGGAATYAVTGGVTITGVLRDASGVSTGTRVLANASGISVYLVGSSGVVDSALTVLGRYRLVGPPGSGYAVRARMGPTLAVSSAPVTIATADVAITAPLELGSVGNLLAFPNPFASNLSIRFPLPTASVVGLSVFSLSDLRVATLIPGNPLPGPVHQVSWNGNGDAGQALPDAPYWIVFSGAGQDWGELVFKGP